MGWWGEMMGGLVGGDDGWVGGGGWWGEMMGGVVGGDDGWGGGGR